MSNFVSIHQFALKIATPPQPNDPTFTYGTINPVGFKNQYDPSGVPGCAIGFPNQSGCAFPGSGSLSLPELTNYKLQAREFRFYVPAGTKSVFFGGYAPQRTQSAFALRFAEPPTRFAALNVSEYAAAQANEHVDSSFKRLISGVELFVVHDGGGSLRFLAGQQFVDNGGWVYVRQLQGDTLYDFQGGIDIDLDLYARGFSQVQWLPNGDAPEYQNSPIVVPPVQPSTGANLISVLVREEGPRNQPLRMSFQLSQTNPEPGTISIWLAAKVYNPKLFIGEMFLMRTKNDWVQFYKGDDNDVALHINLPNQANLSFTEQFEHSVDFLREYFSEFHLGYKINNGPFQKIGQIWKA
jgi:hypothetical protein